ncbi:MAG: GAF domain-containing protein, partial [Syntrophaceae bacterium]
MSSQSSTKRESVLLDLLGKASTFYEDTVGILSGIFRLSEFVGRNAIEKEFFSFLAKVLVEESRCENASVFLVTGDRIYLRGAHGIYNIDCNKDVSMPLGQGVAGMCAMEGTTLLVTDISDCEFFEQRPDSKVAIGSLLCVPIREGKRTIGVFNLS